eukprot:690565_1
MSQVPLTPLFPTPTQNGYNNDHLPPSFPPNTMSTTAHGHGHGHVNHGHNHHPHTHNHPHQSHPHSHNQNIQYLRSNSGDTDPTQCPHTQPESHTQSPLPNNTGYYGTEQILWSNTSIINNNIEYIWLYNNMFNYTNINIDEFNSTSLKQLILSNNKFNNNIDLQSINTYLPNIEKLYLDNNLFINNDDLNFNDVPN